MRRDEVKRTREKQRIRGKLSDILAGKHDGERPLGRSKP
jgi:hypothetical protein